MLGRLGLNAEVIDYHKNYSNCLISYKTVMGKILRQVATN